MSNDLAGVWEVALSDGVHRIEFEHGTTTGKRVIYVDGKVRITISSNVRRGERPGVVCYKKPTPASHRGVCLTSSC